MRLICPNCGAQYEVDARVMPEAGRDVQCSNCGHTWFQRPPHLDADLAAEMGQELRAGPDQQTVAAPAPPRRPAQDVPPAEPSRRRLDPKVAGVLREEAEREAVARRAETGRLESQPDLGLDDTDRSPTPRRVAPMRRDDPDAEQGREKGTRRDLLPDVEEINSTLRASNAPERSTEVTPAATSPERPEVRHRSGFRAGFFLVLFVAVGGALVYAFAPRLAELYPPARDPLVTYVDWVNEARDKADTLIVQGVEKINEMIAKEEADSSG